MYSLVEHICWYIIKKSWVVTWKYNYMHLNKHICLRTHGKLCICNSFHNYPYSNRITINTILEHFTNIICYATLTDNNIHIHINIGYHCVFNY